MKWTKKHDAALLAAVERCEALPTDTRDLAWWMGVALESGIPRLTGREAKLRTHTLRNSPEEIEESWLTAEQLEATYGIPRATAHRWVKLGKVSSKREGRRTLFSSKEAMLQQRDRGNRSGPTVSATHDEVVALRGQMKVLLAMVAEIAELLRRAS